jgi:hypothetical protein
MPDIPRPTTLEPLASLPQTLAELAPRYETFARSSYATRLRARISEAAATAAVGAEAGRLTILQSILSLYDEELREAPHAHGSLRSNSASDSGTCLIRMEAGVPAEDACQHLSLLTPTMSAGFAYPPSADTLQDELVAGTATARLVELIEQPERMSLLTSLVRGRDMGRGILATLVDDSELSFEAEVPLGPLPPSSSSELILHASQYRLFHAYLCLPPAAELPAEHFVGTTLFVDSVDALAARTYGIQGQRHHSEYRVAYALFMFWLWLSDNALDQYNNSLSNDAFVQDIMHSYASVFRLRGDTAKLERWQATMTARNDAGAYEHPDPLPQGLAGGRLDIATAAAIRAELIGSVTNSLLAIAHMMSDLGVDLEGVAPIFDSHLESHHIEKTRARPTQHWEQMLLRLDSGAVEVCLEISRQLSLLEINDQAPLAGFDQAAIRLLKHPYIGTSQGQLDQSVAAALDEIGVADLEPEQRAWYTQVAHAGTMLSPLIRQLDDHGTMYCVLINDLVSLAKDILEGEANPILIEVARRYSDGTCAWESLSSIDMRAALLAEGTAVCREVIVDLNNRWNCLYASAKTLRKTLSSVLDHVDRVASLHDFEVQHARLSAFLRRAVDHLIKTMVFWIAGQNSWNAETPRYQLSLQAILRPLIEQDEPSSDRALRCLWNALFVGRL